jgi:hypothetical protein
MRVVAWLTTILIGSAMLGIGCWFEVVFVASNADLDSLFLIGTEVALIVFLCSGMVLILAVLRT